MTIRDELEAANAKFLDAQRRGDAEALSNWFTEDAFLLPPDSPIIRGRQAIKEHYNEILGDGIDMTITLVDVEEHGDISCAVGTFTSDEGTGKYLEVCQHLGDGTLQMRKMCYNSD